MGMGKLMIAGTVTLALSGCGAGEPLAQRAQTVEPQQQSEQSEPADISGPTPTNIEDALFTLDAMPVGWSEQAPTKSKGDSFFCDQSLPDSSSPIDSAVAQFAADPVLGPTVGHVVTSYEPGEASERLRSMVDILNTCSSFRDSKLKFTPQALAFGTVGDESTAVRYLVENNLGLQFTMDQVFWRQGDVASLILYAAGSPDIKALQKYVRKADAKLQKLYQ